MNTNQKGFANIVLVILVVVLVGVIGYFAFVRKSEPTSAPVNTQPPTTQTAPPITKQTSPSPKITKEKVFRSPLAVTPAPTTSKPLTLYDPLLEAYFEGYDRLYYEFSYPESDFSITTSPDNRKITIKEIATGKIDTVVISYEGGRGFTSQNYWNEVLKSSCPTCEQITNPISIKDSQGLITFASENKEWIIFSGPSAGGGGAWLFVVELQKPTIELEKIISTFAFVEAK